MFESLIIMLREGIEVALIVGLIWAYLRKTGRTQLIPAIYWGLGGGVLASVALAWALRTLDWTDALVEGSMMFIAAALVGSMVLWMMKHAKDIGQSIRQRVDDLAEQPATPAAFWGIGLFTLVMVAREGFETVMFLAAVWVGNEANLLNGVGAAMGLAGAVAFGVLFIRGSIHIDLGRFFRITSIVLLIFIVQLIAYGLHEFGETGLLGEMPGLHAIDKIAENDTLFILAILIVPVLMLLIPGKRRERSSVPRIHHTYRIGGAVAGIVIMAVLVGHDLGQYVHGAETDSMRGLFPYAGHVEIELDELVPGRASVFGVHEDGEVLPLIVLAEEDGSVRVATGVSAAPDRFVVYGGRLTFFDDDEPFDPAHLEPAHLRLLAEVPFEKRGDELNIEVEEIEEAFERADILQDG